MVDLHEEFKDSRFFQQARMDRRAADAMTGLAAGMVADGMISLQEAKFLEGWITSNLAHLDDPVINLLYRRLSNMLADGVLDAGESRELLEMLQCFSGLKPTRPTPSENPFATPNELPINHPAPDMEWPGRVFVFTGVMAFGPRKDCEALVKARGGIIAPGVSKKIHYLVVGSIGNEQWRHTTYGTKIIKAVELREAGTDLAIVSEGHWQKAIFG